MDISAFNKFIVRTPIFPVKNIVKRDYSDLFKEGLFLSSQDFYEIYSKEADISERQSLVLEKFWRRSCFRCTPFGLFAGCSIGKFGEKNNFFLKRRNEYIRKSRLDMGCLGMICEYVKSLPDIYQSTKYYANTSLYELHDKFRYIEYLINSNLVRTYELVSVDYSTHLKEILNFATKGIKYDALVEYLVANNYSNEISKNFINELINSQILVSEIDLQITGADPLDRLIEILKPINCETSIINSLQIIKKSIQSLDDNHYETNMDLYKLIRQELAYLLPRKELKNFLQVDLYKPTDNCIMSREILESVKKGIEVLNWMNSFKDERISRLEQFKSQFISRFGDKEIPLMHALDVDCGIGYNQFINSQSDDSELIEGLVVEYEEINNCVLTARELFLLKRLNKAFLQGENAIELTDIDFLDLNKSEVNIPITFSAFIELTQQNNHDPKIHISYVGGSSATNFIGRFGSTNEEIKDFIEEICIKESKLIGQNKLIAEIVFIPDSRVGNVLFRPGLRKFEIPFMANSSQDLDHQIFVSDLILKVKNGNIVLYSQKLKKEIIPRLSCAHNYNYKTLHVYQFLCDLQHQNVKPNLSFNWGNIENLVSYLPRVCYDNLIFSPAMWIVTQDETTNAKWDSDDKYFEHIVNFFKLPSKVIMEEGDQKLLLDFDNELCRKIFLDALQKGSFVKLTEFFEDDGIVKGPEGYYQSEFIVTFYNNKYSSNVKKDY